MPIKYIAGIDEVGRGPLAGPVCVGICVATNNKKNLIWEIINKARDSKQLTEKQRTIWYKKIMPLKKQGKLFFETSFASNTIIDKKGISYALKLCIKRCILKIGLKPNNCQILLDGAIHAPKEFINQKTIIKGDEKIPIISLASIVAKVQRDNKMKKLAKKYPKYGFEINKGYGTHFHIKTIKKFGPSAIHRKSFIRGILLQK